MHMQSLLHCFLHLSALAVPMSMQSHRPSYPSPMHIACSCHNSCFTWYVIVNNPCGSNSCGLCCDCVCWRPPVSDEASSSRHMLFAVTCRRLRLTPEFLLIYDMIYDMTRSLHTFKCTGCCRDYPRHGKPLPTDKPRTFGSRLLWRVI